MPSAGAPAGLLAVVIVTKIYLDIWGPYGERAMRGKAAAEQPEATGSQGSENFKASSRYMG
jgi:hypothetical protein